MHHLRKNRLEYFKLNSTDKHKEGCSLCVGAASEVLYDETESLAVMHNRMPYDFFEAVKTTGEHYMIVPKQHRDSLAEFTDSERRQYFDLISKYEATGFSIYSRGAGSSTRSQPHQHTHLIKLAHKQPRFFVYITKPYFVLHR